MEQDVSEGRFRANLYYRLNVVHIILPPLRDRDEDLAPLVSHFIKGIGERIGRNSVMISREAMGMMHNYDWPGNIRELENVLEQTMLMMEEGLPIEPSDLPLFMERRGAERRRRFREEALDRMLSLDEYAREFIQRYQDHHTEKELAGYLGITPKTLWEKRKKWSIPRSRR